MDADAVIAVAGAVASAVTVRALNIVLRWLAKALGIGSAASDPRARHDGEES